MLFRSDRRSGRGRFTTRTLARLIKGDECIGKKPSLPLGKKKLVQVGHGWRDRGADRHSSVSEWASGQGTWTVGGMASGETPQVGQVGPTTRDEESRDRRFQTTVRIDAHQMPGAGWVPGASYVLTFECSCLVARV